MAGIKDIAKLTGLSLATISRVFNDSELVSPKTKKKVLKAAEDLDYQPNMMASALRSGRSKIVGVIVPEINNHFFSSIINGIEQKLRSAGYHLIIAQSHEAQSTEITALQSFIQLNVVGILMSISKETKNIPFLKKFDSKVPVVFFDRLPSFNTKNLVVLDDYKGAFMATQYLIDCGCKNLLHIQGDQNVSIFKNRKKGFVDALVKNNHQVIEGNSFEIVGDIAKDTSLIKKILSKHSDIDGFFAHGDESCLYVINILKTLNIKIPEQIQIIGFGNTEFGTLTNPKMTTVDQKCLEMGILAADMLLKNLKKNNKENSKLVLVPELIIRDSTK